MTTALDLTLSLGLSVPLKISYSNLQMASGSCFEHAGVQTLGIDSGSAGWRVGQQKQLRRGGG
jgi:hypothetical protein